jgi:hypothetical protein
MLFAVKNLDTGKYVARHGLSHSYTVKLKEVRLFINRVAAQSQCCGNENRRGTEADQLSRSAPARRRVWGFRGQEQSRSQENPEMALHWSIERVTDWQQLSEDDQQRKITEAVVWAALVYNLSGITEKNIDEWLFRQGFVRRVDDFYPIIRPRSQDHKRDLFTRAEIERRIGLGTNVTTTSRAAFQKKLIDKVVSDVDRAIRA